MIKKFRRLDNGYIDMEDYENASFDMIMGVEVMMRGILKKKNYI